mgnify:CR=1 FL=1
MNNLTIGIVSTRQNINDKEYECVSVNNLRYFNNKCNTIGIMMYDNYNSFDNNVIKCCDGIVFQGGTDIFLYHYKILEYAINNNIPVLGICMGHQIIGLYSNNKGEESLVKVNNHYNRMHKININKDSILYYLFGNEILVNSRHKFVLEDVSYPFIISAKSDDNYIEAIEYIDDNHFVLGVQFHPEDLDNMDNLYNYFIKECLVRKRKRELN